MDPENPAPVFDAVVGFAFVGALAAWPREKAMINATQSDGIFSLNTCANPGCERGGIN